MVHLDYQVPKETWVPWDLLDLLADQVHLADQVPQVLKVNPGSQVEMVFQVLLDLKERGATLACRDLQEPPHHHRASREPKETRGYQVFQVFLVRKASKVSLVTLDNQEETGVQDFLDHQVLKEILASQEAPGGLALQDQKAAWEKWDSQDHQDRRVYQVSQVGQEPQDCLEHLVSQEPKVNLALLGLDHQDYLESRASKANQASQEVQERRERQDHLVSQVYLEDQGPKEILACQDSKVPLVSPVQRV